MAPVNVNTLILDIAQTGQALAVQATIGDETRRYEVAEQQKIPAKLRTIYRLLNPTPFLWNEIYGFLTHLRKAVGWPDIHSLLAETGHALYSPIQEWVESARAIEFILKEDCLGYPLEALYYQGRPLFLHKPSTYRLGGGHPDTHLHVSEGWKGVLIADKTSDPEEAVLGVKSLFPNSIYFDSLEVHPEDLQGIPAADFVLISGHGGPDDGIDLKHIPIRPQTLVHMAPKLVYLDSCQLGLNLGFLHSLEKSGALYYLAPTLSNESGESSTRTIERFFGALLAGEPPANALFKARKSLYEHYTDEEGDDFRVAMFRAFPFRVYRLN